MGERERADEMMLAELGWLTISWARLEGYVDLLSAYLSKNFDAETIKLPSSFSGRVKYIKKTLKGHVFINMYLEVVSLMDQSLHLSRERNDIVHGILTSWKGAAAARVILRHNREGYEAVEGLDFDPSKITNLCKSIRVLSVKLFDALERVKAITGLLNGDEEFWKKSTLTVSDD